MVKFKQITNYNFTIIGITLIIPTTSKLYYWIEIVIFAITSDPIKY